jgi:DNA-binding SARP family transcriptional activator
MTRDRATRYAKSPAGTVRLTLTGEFELTIDGRHRAVPHSAERVLAYLALTEHPVSRTRLAGTLWLDVPEQRAVSSLRTTLWRLGRVGDRLLAANADRLQLSAGVGVDVVDLASLAKRLIREPQPADLTQLPFLLEHAEVLPDWEDGWIAADRERFRLLRLEALERAASALIDRHRFGEALVSALACVQSEPLRESARRLVVRVHVAQGNLAEALRTYREYQVLLGAELGIEPSRLMQQLIEPLRLRGAVTVR